ncbi:hypothetical protein [Streptomyces sp. NPDC002250]|uniref:hypothetical protein n=1 Tax=Streptomyces sp. NPDC002250 TaxID=3364641 RepID=UPI0036A2B313
MRTEPRLHLMVPDDFDDSDADSQVHPMARKMFFGSAMAEPFAEAAAWVAAHDVRIIDTAWENAPAGETFSCVLSVYFTFEDDGRDWVGVAEHPGRARPASATAGPVGRRAVADGAAIRRASGS